MIEYRKARPDEREAYIDLANLVFNLAYGCHDFEKQLPKVYEESVDSASMHRVAVDEHGRIRALVALMPDEATVCGQVLRTGYIGSVGVHPKARGEGHMKRLMSDWLEEMRDTCDMAILTGQRQRYEYFGFTYGGTCAKYAVTSTNVRHALKDVDASDIIFVPLFETDRAEEYALRLNAARPAFVHRDARPLADTLVTFSQRPLAILDKGHRMGYLIAGQNDNNISELAIEQPDRIAPVIKAYMAYTAADKLNITAPEYDIALNVCLGGFAEEESIAPSAMYNIFNYAKVLLAYLTLKHQTIGLVPGEFSAVLDGQPVTACVGARGVTVEQTASPNAITLDKRRAEQLLLTPYGRYVELSSPHGWFPLPIFWYLVDRF